MAELETAPTDADVVRMLDVSTSHLPQDICENLGDYNLITTKREFGWLIVVPEIINNHLLPEPLARLLVYAERRNCPYILLDADGPNHESLSSYDW